MRQVRIALLVSLFVVMVCSCSHRALVGSDPGFTSQGIDAWLNSKTTSPPKVDLTGKWDAGSAFAGGWGEGNFIQEKAVFSGLLGLYNIKGVVSGNDVHFALMSNGIIYYTGEMAKKDDGNFFGKAVKGVFVDTEAAKTAESYPISFQKMK